MENIEHDLLEAYLQASLGTMGYLDAKPLWSLSYCQGDGVAFESHMLGDDLIYLFDRLGLLPLVRYSTNSDSDTFEEEALWDSGLCIEHTGNHYVHECSMECRFENEYLSDERFRAIEDAISEDVKQTSMKLRNLSYALLEQTGHRFIDFPSKYCDHAYYDRGGYAVTIRGLGLEEIAGCESSADLDVSGYIELQSFAMRQKAKCAIEVDFRTNADDFDFRYASTLDIKHHEISVAQVRRRVREAVAEV